MARSHIGRMLEAKIAEVLVERQQDIGSGSAKTYDQYRQQVGYLHGLRDALKYLDDIEREPDERDTSA